MSNTYFLKHEQLLLLERSSTREQIAGTGAVHALEQKLKSHFGKKYCLSTCNATTGLLATALAADLRGKEVLTSPLNWGGSIGPFAMLGNTMALGALRHDDLNLAPEFIKLCISTRTAAVLVPDQGGTRAEGPRIREFCDAHGLLFISDSACSLGAFDHMGKAAGHHAHVVVTSFVTDKGISAGEGGAVLTDDPQLYERLLQVAAHPERQKKELGFFAAFSPLNARIHPMAAQLLAGTWDLQMHRMCQRQKRIGEVLRTFSTAYHVGCFLDARSSTFQNVLLRAMPEHRPDHPLVALPFVHKLPEAGIAHVDFRVPGIVSTVLGQLEEGRYVAVNSIMERQWHTW